MRNIVIILMVTKRSSYGKRKVTSWRTFIHGLPYISVTMFVHAIAVSLQIEGWKLVYFPDQLHLWLKLKILIEFPDDQSSNEIPGSQERPINIREKKEKHIVPWQFKKRTSVHAYEAEETLFIQRGA